MSCTCVFTFILTQINNKMSEFSTLRFLRRDLDNSSFRKAVPQILAVLIKNTLIIGFGMTLGFPTILIPGLSESNEDDHLTLDADSLSWIGSINLMCVPFGCILSGFITQAIGRKLAMQLVNIPLIIAWLLFRFSSELWHIYLGLCLSGLGGGLMEAPVLTYVAEITQPNLRGALSSISTTSTLIGILIEFLLGTILHWRMAALMSFTVPVLAINLLFFVPESPHWLIKNGQIEKAWINFGWLRGWQNLPEIKSEFVELRKTLWLTEQTKTGSWRPFTKNNFLWPYSLVIFTFFLLHFSGTTCLQTFSVEIFSSFNTSINKYHATVILGLAQVAGCLMCVCIIHCVGKRLLNITTMFLAGVCYTGIGIYAQIGDIREIKFENSTNQTNLNWNQIQTYQLIPVTLMIGAAFFSHVGLRILPWVLIGEVFSNETRATASGLSSGIGYVIGFAACKSFFKIVACFTLPGTFWFYGIISFVGCVVIFFILPETEGKTLKEISDHFSGKKSLTNDVGVSQGFDIKQSCYVNLDITNYNCDSYNNL